MLRFYKNKFVKLFKINQNFDNEIMRNKKIAQLKNCRFIS